MRITLDDEPLTGDDLDEQASGLRVRTIGQAEIVPLIRAAAPAIYDRGNVYLEVSFRLLRQHATPGEAQEHVMGHAANLSRAITTATFTTVGGAVKTLSPAVLTTGEGEARGITSLMTYTLTGRLVT